jgi:amidohydrolase
MSKDTARAVIAAHQPDLISLSHNIHSHPELQFEEHLAAEWSTVLLDHHGFEVERHAGGLPTAFVATAGDGDLVLGICAEYDALPGIGHACGHNLICAASVGAALALSEIASDIGITVKVIGTPAEEGGGGKSILLDQHVFDPIHAALMAHPIPGDFDLLDMGPVILASSHFDVTYMGRAAHAAGAPHDGINALDAIIVAQNAIGLLRQQLLPDDSVHGYVRHGGDAANIIPDHTVMEYQVRAPTLDRVHDLEARVRRCFEAGALATGCDMEFRRMAPDYSHLEADRELVRYYGENVKALGRDVIELPRDGPQRGAASTDMGNVSRAFPAIHPGFGVASAIVAPHHEDFASACITPEADDALCHAATALAWTAIDAAIDSDLRLRLLRRERRPFGSAR